VTGVQTCALPILIVTSTKFRRLEFFFSVRQETEALVRVYQKLVASSADVMAGQAAGSGQGTLLTSAGAAPGVCEVRRIKHQLYDKFLGV
jgi:hypothetical protein